MSVLWCWWIPSLFPLTLLSGFWCLKSKLYLWTHSFIEHPPCVGLHSKYCTCDLVGNRSRKNSAFMEFTPWLEGRVFLCHTYHMAIGGIKDSKDNQGRLNRILSMEWESRSVPVMNTLQWVSETRWRTAEGKGVRHAGIQRLRPGESLTTAEAPEPISPAPSVCSAMRRGGKGPRVTGDQDHVELLIINSLICDFVHCASVTHGPKM